MAVARGKQGPRYPLPKYFTRNLRQFLNETALHAMNYVGNASITIWERLYFLISFIVVVVVALNLAVNIFYKWQNTPVITTFNSHSTDIKKVPFPAITICNMNQALASKMSQLKPGTVNYAMMQKTCFLKVNFTDYKHIRPKNNDDTFTNFLLQSTHSCSEMILFCKFGNVEKNCNDFFREILTDEGLCCVFNAVHPYFLFKGEYQILRSYTSTSGLVAVDWSLENGYSAKRPSRYYPREAAGPGVSLGFTIVLNAAMSEYFCSSTNGAGFKLQLHSPIDMPQMYESALPVMIGQQSRFRITVRSDDAVPLVRSISPKRRGCLFNDERHLLYHKYYTRRNCELECDAEYMLKRCKCLAYYMPLIYENATYCHVKDFDCTATAESEISSLVNAACRDTCLPGCFGLTYFPNIFATPFAEQDYGMNEKFFLNFTKAYIRRNFAFLQFYYKDSQYRSYLKTTYTGFTDYLSQTGGIMSIMMGFSVISLAEIFYFSILRPIFDYVLRRPLKGVKSSGNDDVAAAKQEIFTIKKVKEYNHIIGRFPTQKIGIAKTILNNRRLSNRIGSLKGSRKFKSELLGQNAYNRFYE